MASCHELMMSTKLRRLLEVVLAVGNFMNKGARGDAFGEIFVLCGCGHGQSLFRFFPGRKILVIFSFFCQFAKMSVTKVHQTPLSQFVEMSPSR